MVTESALLELGKPADDLMKLSGCSADGRAGVDPSREDANRVREHGVLGVLTHELAVEGEREGSVAGGEGIDCPAFVGHEAALGDVRARRCGGGGPCRLSGLRRLSWERLIRLARLRLARLAGLRLSRLHGLTRLRLSRLVRIAGLTGVRLAGLAGLAGRTELTRRTELTGRLLAVRLLLRIRVLVRLLRRRPLIPLRLVRVRLLVRLTMIGLLGHRFPPRNADKQLTGYRELL